MGGGSGSSGNSNTNSFRSTTYSKTTTSNPYITSTTNNKGTTTKWQDGTALKSINDFTNSNIDSLLNEYLNPSLDNATNQAKMKMFSKTLEENTRKNLENDIIAPLAQRNMIRSSQATDMYNQLAKQNNEAISDYATSLLASSQNDSANVINNLMNYVLQGWNVVNGNQAMSLNTSQGNAAVAGASNTSSKSSGYNYGL